VISEKEQIGGDIYEKGVEREVRRKDGQENKTDKYRGELMSLGYNQELEFYLKSNTREW
jgi:hypothetical protein